MKKEFYTNSVKFMVLKNIKKVSINYNNISITANTNKYIQ